MTPTDSSLSSPEGGLCPSAGRLTLMFEHRNDLALRWAQAVAHHFPERVQLHIDLVRAEEHIQWEWPAAYERLRDVWDWTALVPAALHSDLNSAPRCPVCATQDALRGVAAA